MVEITNGMSAGELTRWSITKHNILVKGLSPKIKREGRQFIRLSVRDETDNGKLLVALRKEL